MGYKDKKYGVTWRTTRSDNPTTVWFNHPAQRSSFIVNLKSNPIVDNHSIFSHNKNVDE